VGLQATLESYGSTVPPNALPGFERPGLAFEMCGHAVMMMMMMMCVAKQRTATRPARWRQAAAAAVAPPTGRRPLDVPSLWHHRPTVATRCRGPEVTCRPPVHFRFTASHRPVTLRQACRRDRVPLGVGRQWPPNERYYLPDFLRTTPVTNNHHSELFSACLVVQRNLAVPCAKLFLVSK